MSVCCKETSASAVVLKFTELFAVVEYELLKSIFL